MGYAEVTDAAVRAELGGQATASGVTGDRGRGFLHIGVQPGYVYMRKVTDLVYDVDLFSGLLVPWRLAKRRSRHCFRVFQAP